MATSAYTVLVSKFPPQARTLPALAGAHAVLIRFMASANPAQLAQAAALIDGLLRPASGESEEVMAGLHTYRDLMSDIGNKVADRVDFLKDFTAAGTALTDTAVKLQASASAKRWLGKSAQRAEWIVYLKTARMVVTRRDDDQETQAEPQPRLQGEGSARGGARREDACGIGAAVRHTSQSDHAVALAASGRRRRRLQIRTTAIAATPVIDVKTLHAKIGDLTLADDFLEGALDKAGLLPSARR